MIKPTIKIRKKAVLPISKGHAAPDTMQADSFTMKSIIIVMVITSVRRKQLGDP